MSSEHESIVRAQSPSAPVEARDLAPPRHGVEPPEPKLSKVQSEALELLTQGLGYTEVAKMVGVDRGTIYRWRTYDANFIAALNRWRASVTDEMRDRILALGELATTSVKKSVDEGDGGLGLKVLEKMGCLKPGAMAPVDPYAVFAVGLEDEQERRAIAEGFHRLHWFMSPDQRGRAYQLLAIGLSVEIRRQGREVPRLVEEMATMGPAMGGGGDAGPAVIQVEACVEQTANEPPARPTVEGKSWRGAATPHRRRVDAVIYDARVSEGPRTAEGAQRRTAKNGALWGAKHE